MAEFVPKSSTTWFLVLFFVSYSLYLLLKIQNYRVDLYDFFLLMLVGAAPVFFVLFPHTVNILSRWVGVYFPFLLLFGFLFLTGFVLMFRLVLHANRLKQQLIRTIQRMAILEKQLKDLNANQQSNHS